MYSDTIEKSSEYLRLALDHMGRYRLPVDPANYSVWYEYVSGRNDQLKLIIDDALSRSKGISLELNKTLYEKYIANDYKVIIKKIREELGKVLDTILGHVVDTGGQLTGFATMLNIYSNRLKDDLDADSVRNIANEIILETQTINTSGKLLKERIISSTREIEILRKDLDKLRQEATSDTLTGLRNRRYLISAFDKEANHAKKSGSSLSLIIADIDHFKKINDKYGHLIGDRVLKTSAKMLTDCVKGKDIIVRYGGEEFVILLPDTAIDGATTLGNKLCTYFKNMNWKRKDTGEIIEQVHISGGVAQYRIGESLDSLVQRADMALYWSKQNGRCRVTSEHDIPGDQTDLIPPVVTLDTQHSI
ncbi:MAG TPA: GGDEF domain-containing protein [Deltaproteobacteria bacterium]|nr:GGDEF domain-containing protein [Deltaproteobacteria bacterium]